MGHPKIIVRADMRRSTRNPHPSQRLDKEDCVHVGDTADGCRC